MARLYSRTSKGRTALLSSPVRLTRSRNTNNSASTSGKTYPVPSKTSALAPTRVIKTKRKQTSLNILNDSYGSQEDGISDSAEDAQDADNDGDDDEEEEEEDEEEPDDHAPPFASKLHRAGRIVSPNDYEEGLFASLDDDDDDDVYEAVNDISDYEDDVGEADVENFALQDIMAMGPTVFESESEDDPNAILDDIDGLSVLGFGGDFDGLEGPSSSDDSSSSTSIREVVMERRVRFHSDVDESNVLTGSVSPLLTRALLPSALPDNYGIDRSVIASDMGRWSNRPITSQRHGFFEDDDDSMSLRSMLLCNANDMQVTLRMRIYRPKHILLQMPSTKHLATLLPRSYLYHHQHVEMARNSLDVPRAHQRDFSKLIGISLGPFLTLPAKRLSWYLRQTLTVMTGSKKDILVSPHIRVHLHHLLSF